jgi:tRNA1(Val) A37 N6-methylase TrmN6
MALTDLSTVEQGILSRAEDRRIRASRKLDPADQSSLGQYFTPAPLAALMADMADPVDRNAIRILDPGAGSGSLTSALVAAICQWPSPPPQIEATLIEVHPRLESPLRETLEDCASICAEHGIAFDGEVRITDFLRSTALAISSNGVSSFDIAILNPPYGKIRSNSREREWARACGVEVSNLYAAFVAATVASLAPNGQMVAITPRSFTNGTYFRRFRHPPRIARPGTHPALAQAQAGFAVEPARRLRLPGARSQATARSQQRPHAGALWSDRAGQRTARQSRQAALPDGITFHALRRTYAALRAELGEHPAITAAQMGHRDPRMTLRVYTDVTGTRPRTSMGGLLGDADWAPMGTDADPPDAEPGEQLSLEEAGTSALAGQTANGSDGTRTRGLRRDSCVATRAGIPHHKRDSAVGASTNRPTAYANLCVACTWFRPKRCSWAVSFDRLNS